MVNPFIQQADFKLKVIKVVSSRDNIDIAKLPGDAVITNTDAVNTYTSTYLAEKLEKITVYNIPNITGMLYKSLTTSGRDLLLFVIYNTPRDRDYIKLPYKETSVRMQISRVTLKKAIDNLVENAILLKKSQSEYWINPHFFFNGNKIEYFKEYYPEYIDVVATTGKAKKLRGEEL